MTENPFQLPKGEIAWVRGCNSNGTLCYVIASNKTRDHYFLYVLEGDYIYKYPLIHIFSVCHKHGCHIGSREHQKKNGLIPS